MKRISVTHEIIKNISVDIFDRCRNSYVTIKELNLIEIFNKNGYSNKGYVSKTILNYLVETKCLNRIATSQGVAYKLANIRPDCDYIAESYLNWLHEYIQEGISKRKELRVATIQKGIDLGDKVYFIQDNSIFSGIVESITKEYTDDNKSSISTSYVIRISLLNRVQFTGMVFRSFSELINDLKENIIEYQEDSSKQ